MKQNKISFGISVRSFITALIIGLIGCSISSDVYAVLRSTRKVSAKKFLFSAGYFLTTNDCGISEPESFDPIIKIIKARNNAITATVPSLGTLQGKYKSRRYSASGKSAVKNSLVKVSLSIRMNSATTGSSTLTVTILQGGASCKIAYEGDAELL